MHNEKLVSLKSMTFYTETVAKISRDWYPKDHIVQQVIKAKQFIDRHFADPIDLDAMALEAFYSKFHFIRCFKALYGRTPHQHLISVRMEAAKHFLETDARIADICYRVGFESVTSFTSLFKKMTSVTPAVYRDRKKAIFKN
ncbi:AraC-type DNA-binding protein [Spirosoma endophyticum]|uniref:AraC-type DNA-binding protein n=2 Tax=Spirosoma endophyticum TaxID=662367 RepID=A0A1I1IDD8_9BACT|nr:AraC-type DNA-binding protein [Spirosoma endophyticum]